VRRTRVKTSEMVIKTSAIQADKNHTRAGVWSSGLRAKTLIATSLSVVQMPPAACNLIISTPEATNDLSNPPKETTAKSVIKSARALDLVRRKILQAKNSWIGIETRTCRLCQTKIFFSSRDILAYDGNRLWKKRIRLVMGGVVS